MRIYCLILVLISCAACKKNPAPAPPPVAADTLSTGWKKVALPAQFGADVFFFDNTTGFAVGGNNINRSTDGGNTWQRVYQSSVPFVNIAMGSTANAVFTTTSVGSTRLLVTSDGGNSFDSVNVADGITDAFLVSATTGYAIGQKFWKTTDGGRHWANIADFSATPVGYKSLHFLSDQIGWWAGTGGVYKTINGGVDWTAQPVSGFNIGTGSIYFVDANTGYLGYDAGVGKSTNGGAAWTKIYSLSGTYHDVHFVSASTGYVTDNHDIFKTIDGGSTWTKEVHISDGSIIELHFTDANHGWAIYGGNILKFER